MTHFVYVCAVGTVMIRGPPFKMQPNLISTDSSLTESMHSSGHTPSLYGSTHINRRCGANDATRATDIVSGFRSIGIGSAVGGSVAGPVKDQKVSASGLCHEEGISLAAVIWDVSQIPMV